MAENYKIVVINMNDIVPDLSDSFQRLNPSELFCADALIVAQDVIGRHRDDCKTAKKYGVPSFVVQHGRYAASDYSSGKYKPVADFFLAWGQNDVKQAIRGGWSEDRVIRIGSPLFIDKSVPEPDGKTVVFAPLHCMVDEELYRRNADEAMEIWTLLRKMEGIAPIAKLLTGEHIPPQFPGTQFITRRRSEGHIKKIYRELLNKTSCVVSQKEGTFELLAYSIGIPVVRLKNIHCLDPFPASRIVDGIDKLEDAIRDAIAYPKQDKDVRQEAIYQTGGSQGDTPKESMVEFIREKIAELKRKKEVYVN